MTPSNRIITLLQAFWTNFELIKALHTYQWHKLNRQEASATKNEEIKMKVKKTLSAKPRYEAFSDFKQHVATGGFREWQEASQSYNVFVKRKRREGEREREVKEVGDNPPLLTDVFRVFAEVFEIDRDVRSGDEYLQLLGVEHSQPVDRNNIVHAGHERGHLAGEETK